MRKQNYRILRLILGDQLNSQHSWYKEKSDDILYVMMECKSETDYVTHHIQKIIGFFASMRQFASSLQEMGHHVYYISLDESDNTQQIDRNCLALMERYQISHFEYQIPDEYRLVQHLEAFTNSLPITFQAYDTEHFFTTQHELAQFFDGKGKTLMETFYRYMRKKHNILMKNEGEPLFGKWNFDFDNRKKLPKSHSVVSPYLFSNDLSKIEDLIKAQGIKSLGVVNSKEFLWPVNRKQSLDLLIFFCNNCLSLFGSYQDAMDSNYWSVYHSRLSFALNLKLISPNEVIEEAISAYEQSEGNIGYNQLEGFVRQILGWREYMRGIYWKHMPEYKELNFFNHKRKLPDWFWNGDTKMKCLHKAISQSNTYAYAHHIQRLMLTGNFALLAGIQPDEVDDWYLGIYIDAIEWVELPNTRGMSQYADGGIVASKPYISSASYIHKMSNYCESCYYNHAKKTGDKACPFNSLYWNFLQSNENKLSSNPRIGMMFKVWQKFSQDQQTEILHQATFYLNNLNDL